MSSETEEIAHFRPIDLPHISVNSDFDSSEYSDLEGSTGFSNPSTPETPKTTSTPTTPSTPATPLTQLTTSVTSFGFTDAETSTFALPSTKRTYRRKRPGFQKGNLQTKKRLFTTETPIKRERSTLASKIKSYEVLLKKADKTTSRELYVPHGAEVMNMDILVHVLSLLRCNEPHCPGAMMLHKLPRKNGLQSYFILHCKRCHSVVAEFSSSPHIGEYNL